MPGTIRELAKRLGLSITTVSRAIDGYPDVAESTRQRVLRAAHEVGYTPNKAARQLRKQRTDTIGYILPGRSPRFTDPFFSEFIAGMGDAIAGSSYDLLLSSAPPGEAAEQDIYIHWMNAQKVDGFILNRMRLHDWRVQFLSEHGIPFVTLERTRDPFDYPCVTVQGKQGIQQLVAHLVDGGHTRIAYIGGLPDLVIHSERYQGYTSGLEQAGIPLEPGFVLQGDLSREDGYQAAVHLLSLHNPPDAIVCENDYTAFGVLDAARERGSKIGENLAVTGFDGLEEAAHSLPPLTTLSQSIYAISQAMVKMLLAQINHEPLESTCLSFSPKLIIRESTTGSAC